MQQRATAYVESGNGTRGNNASVKYFEPVAIGTLSLGSSPQIKQCTQAAQGFEFLDDKLVVAYAEGFEGVAPLIYTLAAVSKCFGQIVEKFLQLGAIEFFIDEASHGESQLRLTTVIPAPPRRTSSS